MAQKGITVASAEGTAKQKPGLFKLPHSGIQRIKRKLFSQKQSTDIFRHFEGQAQIREPGNKFCYFH